VKLSAVEKRAADDASIVDKTDEIQAQIKAVQERQSKAGTYDFISPLLDRRRVEHVIPEGAFRFQAAYDRIYVYQIAEWDLTADAKWGDTSIIMPQTAREYHHRETPRGIIVSAGLQAEEVLYGNGMAVGHIVRFIRNAPWAMPVDNINAKPYHVFVMRDGDITGSEDLMANLKAGKVKRVERTEAPGKFCYEDENGRQWDPRQPWIPDDF
jgi:hypothetical protein